MTSDAHKHAHVASDSYDVSWQDFDTRVIAASHERPILVDLWADWCAPCRVIAPLLEQLVAQYEGALALARVEVDDGENMKLAGHYRVRGFPTIILFQNGKEKGRFSGAKPLRVIEQFVADHADWR